MRRVLRIRTRLDSAQSAFVKSNVDSGLYAHVSEYIRALILRDKERVDAERLERLNSEL